ncbi:MAG: peptide ABC transporter substrate-binding protein [Dongiaceae bacterium]
MRNGKGRLPLGAPAILRPSRRDMLKLGLAAGAAGLVGMPAGRLRAAGPPAKPTGQAVIGFSQEPTVFNPHMLHIEVDEGVHWNLFSPLWGVSPEGTFIPYLATEVPTVENGGVSEDGLSWHVKLRGDVKWHDGKPFTAEDVKYTLDLIVDPNFKTARKLGHDLVREIKVISPTEISWKMEKAYAPYHSIMAWTFMVPKHVLGAAKDPNTAPFNNAPVGTGPFKWSERVAGDHITLVANEDYFGDGPYLERIIFKYIPDLTVLFTQFKTGDIDYIGIQGITADHYAEAKDLPDRVVTPVPAGFIETLSLNLGVKALSDKTVRQALYLGMDKKSIIDAIYYGLPSETESYMPNQSFFIDKDLPKHEYSPEKAKKLLDEAGWAPGSDGVRAKDGVRLEFVHATTAGNHVREQAQQFLQQSWKDIGVAININNLPPAVMWGDYWMQSKFESAFAGIAFLTGPDPDASDYFSSKAINAKGGAGQNTFQYANPKLDELLAKGATTLRLDERQKIYREIQSIIRDDLPYLPIFQYAQVEGTKKGLMGFKPSVNVRCNTWNVNEWYWAT